MNLNSIQNKCLIIFVLFFALNHLSKAEVKNDTLSYIVIGHLCLFEGTIAERFEIDCEKDKLYRLTIHASFSHIKGEKHRQKIKTSKKEWTQLNKQISDLIFACEEAEMQEEKGTYFVSFFTNDESQSEFHYSDTNVPIKLKEALEFIRAIK